MVILIVVLFEGLIQYITGIWDLHNIEGFVCSGPCRVSCSSEIMHGIRSKLGGDIEWCPQEAKKWLPHLSSSDCATLTTAAWPSLSQGEWASGVVFQW